LFGMERRGGGGVRGRSIARASSDDVQDDTPGRQYRL
jgi:hypothetical protein